VSSRTCAILTVMAGAAFGAWWMASQRALSTTAKGIPARERGTVIFDNHTIAVEAEGIV
jgi:hypothetical protein